MPAPRAVGEVRYPSSKLGDTLREGVDAGVGLEGVEASGLGERTDETSEWATIWIHWCYLSSLVTLIFPLESALCGIPTINTSTARFRIVDAWPTSSGSSESP